MTLTFDPLTLKVCGRSDGMVVVCTKFDRNRTTPGWVIHNLANFCSRQVSLWPWPLTPWPWTFWSLGRRVFKLCVKFEQNRTIRCTVIDDLARYRREIFAWVVNWSNVLRVRGPNFTKLGENVRPSSMLTEFVSDLRYRAAFSNRAAQSWATLRMRPNFALFDPL